MDSAWKWPGPKSWRVDLHAHSLDVRESQTVIGCEGGFQEETVRAEICRVMEGGREAFESRYNRIMPLKGVS